MIDRSKVAVVIPTRGNVDMAPIVEPFAGLPVIVWDNSVEDDLGVYGRYAAILRTQRPVILTVDDDSVLPPRSVRSMLRNYRPGRVVCNVPSRFRRRYRDSGLVGFGAIFDRDLPAQAFRRFWEAGGNMGDPVFHRCCDLVFTMLTPMRQIDAPYDELPYASDETRMWRQDNHFEEREDMRRFCRQIKAAAA